MIRVEVTSEADVTRMVAAFRVLESLRDCDYEIWLVPHSLFARSMEAEAVRRAWREDGLRGGTGTNATFISHGPGALGGFGGKGGAGGAGHSDVRADWSPVPPTCPVTGWPQIDRPDLDMCSCGHRHIKIECWGGGGGTDG